MENKKFEEYIMKRKLQKELPKEGSDLSKGNLNSSCAVVHTVEGQYSHDNKLSSTNSNGGCLVLNAKYNTQNMYTAIDYVRSVLIKYYKEDITAEDVIKILLSFVKEGLLQPPNNLSFVVNKEHRTSGFEFLSKNKAAERLCIYCKWLGLPRPFYYSHLLKDMHANCTCPLYPLHAVYVADFDDVVHAISEMANLMNVTRCCTYCKDAGKSKEVYLSHIEKLSNNAIVCPFLRNEIKCNAFSSAVQVPTPK